MTKSDKLSRWLSSTISESKDKRYKHRLLKEDLSQRCEILEELRSLVQKAHEDARRHLRDLAGTSLDPLDSLANDPAEGYPECLHIRTLKGYLGEIFAGLVAEKLSPFGEANWRVPTFLFRFHDFAFNELERIRQGKKAKIIPGRPGDDCLAFQLDDQGQIRRSLVCEAKCTSSHDTHLISDAHKQISDPISIPVSIRQIIDILKDRKDDKDALAWVKALQRLWLEGVDSSYERCDLVCYVCGRFPKRKPSWISSKVPHQSYTARRRLEAAEIHLHDVEDIIREVYGKKDARNGSTN